MITFDNLPTLIQDDSVRVEGNGSAGITIAGLEVKRAFLEPGEKKELTFGILVEYPKDREITGL